jgi:hypothetical protein
VATNVASAQSSYIAWALSDTYASH